MARASRCMLSPPDARPRSAGLVSARDAGFPIRVLPALVLVWLHADMPLAGARNLMHDNPDRLAHLVAFTHYFERLTRGVGRPVLVAYPARLDMLQAAIGTDGAIDRVPSPPMATGGAAHRTRAPPR